MWRHTVPLFPLLLMLILIAWPKCCLISLLCSTVFSPSIWLENTLKPCKFCVPYQNFLPAFIIHWWFLLELVFTTVVAKMVVFNFSTSFTECYQWIYSMARAPHSALFIHPPSTHLPIHLSVHLPITRMSIWISIFFFNAHWTLFIPSFAQIDPYFTTVKAPQSVVSFWCTPLYFLT